MSEGRKSFILTKLLTNKLLLLLLTTGCFIIYRVFAPSSDKMQSFPYAFDDKVLLSFLAPITKHLAENLQLRDLVLLSGFLNLDILVLVFLAYYTKHGNSFKPFICFLFFYGLRAAFQTIFLLDYYPLYLFTYPGFRSLTVPTSRAADFFFSGHTGCAFLLALNFKSWKEPKLFYYGCFVTAMQMLVMTVVRAHYSIDVIFGFLVSHYVWIIVNDYCQWIDKVFPWFVDWSKLELQNNDHFLDAGAGVSVSKDKIGRKSNASRQMKILYE